MSTNLRAPIHGTQLFFSDDFLIQVKFNEDDSIDGWLVHYPIGLNLAEKFEAISIEENGVIKFTFFIRWSNRNLDGSVLTAYSGEIFKPESKETRLRLEWLQVREDRRSLGTQSDKGYEVLLGSSEKDSQSRARTREFIDMLEESLRRF